MDENTANELDRLLAGDGISGPEADAIFARVVAEVEREERRRASTRALWGAAAVGIAAAVTLVAGLHDERSAPEFTARGGSAAAGSRLELICTGGSLDACPISSKLVFAVTGDATSGFLSAYAEPLEPNAERVWYFSRDGHSPELSAVADGTRVFEHAVRLAGTHRPGRYRVHVFLAETALGHAEMLAGASELTRASMQTDLHVVGE